MGMRERGDEGMKREGLREWGGQGGKEQAVTVTFVVIVVVIVVLIEFLSFRSPWRWRQSLGFLRDLRRVGENIAEPARTSRDS